MTSPPLSIPSLGISQSTTNCLRIGHADISTSYLLKDEDPQHVYLVILYQLQNSCGNFDIIRRNFYTASTASNLKDLFHNIHSNYGWY